MSNPDRMNKVDISKLKFDDKSIINLLEKDNLQRVTKLKALRRKNLVTFGILGVGVLSIYGYTIFSVKQERFLDDFELPKTTTASTK